MMHRLVLLSVLASATASASPPELGLAAGGGASIVVSDPCGFEGCATPRTRLVGAGGVVRASLGLRHALSPRLSLRYGGALAGLFMSDSKSSGSIVTGGGEFGVTLDRWSADVVAGLSLVRVHTDQMTATGPTMAFGASAGFAITPQLSAFVRADMHAAMEGPIGGVFAGAGLSWRL